MADKPLPWFRLYSEMVTDRKITTIARLADCSRLQIIGALTTLLALASESPVRGTLLITQDVPYELDDLCDAFEMEGSHTEGILLAFQKLEILDYIDDAWVIRNWNKRQYKSDDSYERVTKHRENNKQNVTSPLQDRYSNAQVTPPELRVKSTESETELREQEPDNNNVAAFAKFQNEIGMLTPRTSDMVGGWIDDYGDKWTCEAIDEAIKQNVRKPAYIDKILQNWKTNGRNGNKPEKRTPTLEEQGYKRVGE